MFLLKGPSIKMDLDESGISRYFFLPERARYWNFQLILPLPSHVFESPQTIFGLWKANSQLLFLKGLSHEIFTVIFWLEWIYLGLIENRYWFLNIKEGSLILDSYFEYWCVPYQTFSEICRISEKEHNWICSSPIFLSSGLEVLRETLQRVSILLGDS